MKIFRTIVLLSLLTTVPVLCGMRAAEARRCNPPARPWARSCRTSKRPWTKESSRKRNTNAPKRTSWIDTTDRRVKPRAWRRRCREYGHGAILGESGFQLPALEGALASLRISPAFSPIRGGHGRNDVSQFLKRCFFFPPKFCFFFETSSFYLFGNRNCSDHANVSSFPEAR